MTEDKNQDIGVFRFGVIHEFVGGASLTRVERRRLIKEKCSRKWVIPYSARTRVTENTIYRWIRRYKKSGNKIESLYPHQRKDTGRSRNLSGENIAAIVRAKKQHPDLPIPKLVENLKYAGLVPRSTGLTTVYRVLHQNGLMAKEPIPEDRRKFEAKLPNDIWQSDVMHGPKVGVDGKQRKTYLIAFIDDHSRLIVYSGFYLSEKLTCFMDAFYQALAKRGLPGKLYVDNGAAYRSRQLEFTCASLAIALVHARPYKPQGKGKIERFFRTVRSQFLPEAVISSVENLNTSFNNWVDGVYHQREHRATGMTPFHRFTRKLGYLRQSPKDLKDYFRKAVYRKVAKDRTVTLGGRLFEAAVSLIGKRVLLRYHDHEPNTVEAFFKGQSYGLLTPVNLHVNARVKRDRNNNPQLETTQKMPYKGGDLWK